MNNRIKTKRNKRFLIDSILESPFVEKGCHWVAKTFEPGLRWRESRFGSADQIVVDAKVIFAVHLMAMLDAPRSAREILEPLFEHNPGNGDVAAELLECYLELGLDSEAKELYLACKNNPKLYDAAMGLSEYFEKGKIWDKYCSSGITKEVVYSINRGDFDRCRQLLSAKDGLEVELLRLSVLGAENLHKLFLDQLKHITSNFVDVYRDFKFWFYRSTKADSDPEYWKLCAHPSFSKYAVILKK